MGGAGGVAAAVGGRGGKQPSGRPPPSPSLCPIGRHRPWLSAAPRGGGTRGRWPKEGGRRVAAATPPWQVAWPPALPWYRPRRAAQRGGGGHPTRVSRATGAAVSVSTRRAGHCSAPRGGRCSRHPPPATARRRRRRWQPPPRPLRSPAAGSPASHFRPPLSFLATTAACRCLAKPVTGRGDGWWGGLAHDHARVGEGGGSPAVGGEGPCSLCAPLPLPALPPRPPSLAAARPQATVCGASPLWPSRERPVRWQRPGWSRQRARGPPTAVERPSASCPGAERPWAAQMARSPPHCRASDAERGAFPARLQSQITPS